jgi:hypothetical protein
MQKTLNNKIKFKENTKEVIMLIEKKLIFTKLLTKDKKKICPGPY